MFLEEFTRISWMLFVLNMGLLLVVTIATAMILKRKEEKKSSGIRFDVVVFDRYEDVQVVYSGDSLRDAKRFGEWYHGKYKNVDAWQIEFNDEIIYKEKDGK